MKKIFKTALVLFVYSIPLLSFAAPVSFDDALKHYRQNDFRLLIVPGHTIQEWGTEYRGVREGDLTLQLAHYINDLFVSDVNVKTLVTRDRVGELASWLQEYMRNGNKNISEYVRTKVMEERAGIENGQIKIVNGVYHNAASTETQRMLFSVNKFANDNRIDLALHIHFNDYPRKKLSTAGKYNGFSIYVPERQMANSNSSTEFAKNIKESLSRVLAISNYPPESMGVVEDQELIAIGSHGTREGPAVLVEYGYIYESALQDPQTRDEYLRELAYQTYQAIQKTIGGKIEAAFTASIDQVLWQTPPRYGTRSLKAFQLQQVLARAGAYPPAGRTIRDCPVSGFFGACTKRALEDFQKARAKELALISPEKPLEVRTFYLLNAVDSLAP